MSIYYASLVLLVGLVACNKVPVSVTAHRGASGLAPENTMVSIVKAMQLGSDYSELDVQETADGKIILLHDDTLDRTTNGSGNIWEKSYADIKSLDAGSWFSKDFTGEKIPTLVAIMDTVKGKMRLNIELKMNGHQKQLTEGVVSLVEERDFISHCIITSFDFDEVRKAKRLNENIKVGFIFSKMPEQIDVFTANVDLLSVNKKLVNKEFINNAHSNGKEVHVWTVNDQDEMLELIRLGVDNIITDYPDVLLNILKR